MGVMRAWLQSEERLGTESIESQLSWPTGVWATQVGMGHKAEE